MKHILDEAKYRDLNYKNIKEFELNVPFIPKNYGNYIAKYVTRHVEKLKLEIVKQDLYDWINKIGYSNALHLLHSLGNVKDACIRWNPDRTYERQSTDSKSDMTILYSLLHALKEGNKGYCSSIFSDSYGGGISMRYNSKHDLYLECKLNYSDYYLPNGQDLRESERNMEMNGSSRVVEIALPDYSISTIGPEVINHMVVNMNDTQPELLLKFLQYALTNCPNLEYFSYNLIGYPKCGIYIGTDIQNSRFKREEHNRIPNTTQENIKVVKTRNILPSKEMLELMNTYIPGMDTLVCGFDSPYDTPTKNVPVIDLMECKNLSMMIIDVRLLGDYISFIEIDCSGISNYYSLEMDNSSPTFNSVTMEFMEELLKDDKINSKSIVIKCDKHVHFKFYFKYTRIADIINRKLIHKNEASFEAFKYFMH